MIQCVKKDQVVEVCKLLFYKLELIHQFLL